VNYKLLLASILIIAGCGQTKMQFKGESKFTPLIAESKSGDVNSKVNDAATGTTSPIVDGIKSPVDPIIEPIGGTIVGPEKPVEKLNDDKPLITQAAASTNRCSRRCISRPYYSYHHHLQS
jgi:hypothetical protein